MSTEAPQAIHSPSQNPRRPKGILKNTNSYQLSSPNAGQPASPTDMVDNPDGDPISLSTSDPRRPSLPHQQSEKEIVLQNTLANAGNRRNSSNGRSLSRRQSHTNHHEMDVDENSPRLKWDEANLYLNEQERPVTMKIDEPKTPFVKQSDLPEDEDEVASIDPHGVVVDELEQSRTPGDDGTPRGRKGSKVGSASGGPVDIPDLDLGEGAPPMVRTTSSEKRVVVDPSAVAADENAGTVSGVGDTLSTSAEAQRKHREFEERRKKHYEIPPGALHADDEEDDDDDAAHNGAVPPMPSLPPQ